MTRFTFEWQGRNYLLKADGKIVGHFYPDPEEGVDPDTVMAEIAALQSAGDTK
jgi:hypothetical protein